MYLPHELPYAVGETCLTCIIQRICLNEFSTMRYNATKFVAILENNKFKVAKVTQLR